MGGMDKHRMRFESNCSLVLQSASWHCTDCFATIAALKNKISSFAHHELDMFPYNDPAYLVDRWRAPQA
jgi:beta-1,4-mannosyl-glycoprotein beta-1,4-N-acetylglucosaminyltransferase